MRSCRTTQRHRPEDRLLEILQGPTPKRNRSLRNRATALSAANSTQQPNGGPRRKLKNRPLQALGIEGAPSKIRRTLVKFGLGRIQVANATGGIGKAHWVRGKLDSEGKADISVRINLPLRLKASAGILSGIPILDLSVTGPSRTYTGTAIRQQR